MIRKRMNEIAESSKPTASVANASNPADERKWRCLLALMGTLMLAFSYLLLVSMFTPAIGMTSIKEAIAWFGQIQFSAK